MRPGPSQQQRHSAGPRVRVLAPLDSSESGRARHPLLLSPRLTVRAVPGWRGMRPAGVCAGNAPRGPHLHRAEGSGLLGLGRHAQRLRRTQYLGKCGFTFTLEKDIPGPHWEAPQVVCLAKRLCADAMSCPHVARGAHPGSGVWAMGAAGSCAVWWCQDPTVSLASSPC